MPRAAASAGRRPGTAARVADRRRAVQPDAEERSVTTRTRRASPMSSARRKACARPEPAPCVARRAWRAPGPAFAHAEVLRRALDPATGRRTIARLIDEVTIKETSFLRDRRQLDAIDWHGLRMRAREAGSSVVRVWSVACATGEEAYSLALLACEAFASQHAARAHPRHRHLAAALAAATAGRYRDALGCGVEEPLRSRYLERFRRRARRRPGAPRARHASRRTTSFGMRSRRSARRLPPDPLPQRADLLRRRDRARASSRGSSGRSRRAGARARRGGRALRARPRSGRAGAPTPESEAPRRLQAQHRAPALEPPSVESLPRDAPRRTT